MSVDRNTTKKYLNSRIYENVRSSAFGQHAAMPGPEMPLLMENDLLRPKFLGGHFTSKITDNAQSAVKEFLLGQ